MSASISLSPRAVRPLTVGVAVSAAVAIALLVNGGVTDRVQPSVERLPFPYVATTPHAPPVPAAKPAVEPLSGRSAVESSLHARVARDDPAAWALLDAASLRRYPVPEAWAIAQAEIPPPRSFSIVAVEEGDAFVNVTAHVTRTPIVNDSLGFVPAQATEVWRAVNENGRWRVADVPLSSVPDLPTDALAAPAVDAWLQAAAHDRAALQNSSFLYGPRDLIAAAAAENGGWRASGPALRPESSVADATALVAAYGPAIDLFVRLVPVANSSSHAFVAVVPVGERWLVTAVLSPAGVAGQSHDSYGR